VSCLTVALVSEHASPLAVLGGPDSGGQNVHVAALATELGRLGCDVTVYTRRDAACLPLRQPYAPGVVVEHVDAGPPAPIPKDELPPHMPRFADVLRSRWLSRPPDVVHSHFWMSGWAGLTAARAVGVPVVQTFHALGAVKRRHQGSADTSPTMREGAERHLALSCDAIVATCADEVRELVALGADRHRLHVVPCGIDPVLFSASAGPPPHGRNGCAARIVAVSRLVPRKGLADAVAALRDVPGAELVIAGGPPRERLGDDPEACRLRSVAATAGVADRVTLLGGLDRADVPRLLRSADVVVCPPWYEPFGIVPLEAMACGVPVVGTAVGGLLDTVVDGVTGLLVAPRRPRELGRALSALLADPARRDLLGRTAARRVRSRFTWAGVAQSTLQVYDGVLNQVGTRRVPA
jgi:D-inositol-3-phosphate glycosyltransferase